MTPTEKRIYSHGVDVTDAGTFQERYFMVLAGLLRKNQEVLEEIRDLLKTPLQPTAVLEKVSTAVNNAPSKAPVAPVKNIKDVKRS